MNLFIADQIDHHEAVLTGEEAQHCVKVLRLQTGDTIHLTDGKGTLFTGIIKTVANKQCVVQITAKKAGIKHPYQLHIAIAPTKNISRFEWFLEKAVEIGVDEITPIICAHSERKHIQFERALKIIRSAVKQSLHTHIPVLHPQASLQEMISDPDDQLNIAAHYHSQNKQLAEWMDIKRSRYKILIGPEGDFSADEIKLLVEKNWILANLGHYRLRTETAGIAAAQIVSFNRWK